LLFYNSEIHLNILYRLPNYQIFQAVTWLWNLQGYFYFQQTYVAAGF